ncbi:MAG: porin [Beijerinckiaceae bacterium]
MKLVKSLLLGSAAGLVVASGAMAADLPARKAAPAEYVRVCSAYGAGFFYIPGTETCIKVGGLVRYQYEFRQQKIATSAATGTRAQMNFEFDVRNATAYGTLRTFARLSVARRTGTAFSGTQGRLGQAINSTATVQSGVNDSQTVVALDKAFIQFGGLTAGRAASFFDFYADAGTFSDGMVGSNVGSTNLLAYTAVFGGGFSATLSLEDPIERRSGVLGSGPVLAPAIANINDFRYSAVSAPDIVAALRVDQSWGSAQLSGALHQVRSIATAYPGPGLTASKWGWAVQGGLKLNLPMIAPGDQLWLQAAYANGATSYGGMTNLIAGATPTSNIGGVLPTTLADGFADATGRLSLVKSWSIAGAFIHYWTPALRSGFYGSYGQVDLPASANLMSLTDGRARDYNAWRVGTNLTWSPVPNFDIGADVGYTKGTYRGGVGTSLDVANGAPLIKSVGQWHAVFRVQRGF